MEATDRLPPQDLTAEASVLGSMLLDATTIPEVAGVLAAEEFYSPDHQAVYRAAVALSDAGQPVDAVTLADALKASGDLDRIGGAAFLVELLAAVPSTANAVAYAEIVRACSRRRRLIAAGSRMATLAYDAGEGIDSVLAACEREFYEAAGTTRDATASDFRDVLADVLAAAMDGRAPEHCLPTGYEDLDDKLVGLPDGTLTVVGARPSMGKSTLARNITLKAIVPRFRRPVGGPAVPALFFSLEESGRTLVSSLLCCLARVNGHSLRRGMLHGEERERLSEAAKALDKAPLWVDDRPHITVAQMRSQAQRLKLRVPDLGLIVVDYLQLVSVRGGRSREQEVASIVRGLKHLARELQVPVLALSQLSRAVEARADTTPRLSDLRESGTLEQDADIVLLLHRPRYYQTEADERELNVIVAKQRNGPTGDVKLAIFLSCTRLEDWIQGDVETQGREEGA